MQKNYFVTGRLNYSMAFKLQSVKFELRLPSNVQSNGLTLDGGGEGAGYPWEKDFFVCAF